MRADARWTPNRVIRVRQAENKQISRFWPQLDIVRLSCADFMTSVVRLSPFTALLKCPLWALREARRIQDLVRTIFNLTIENGRLAGLISRLYHLFIFPIDFGRSLIKSTNFKRISRINTRCCQHPARSPGNWHANAIPCQTPTQRQRETVSVSSM